jgi:dihydrofolate reductase
MGKVAFDISISLDGYVAGPNDSPDNGLGDAGEGLHEWVLETKAWREPHGYEGGKEGPENDLMARAFEAGAIIIGRRMYDNARAWGGKPPFGIPVFILTSEEKAGEEFENGTTFTFLSDPEEALGLAREAAGDQLVAIGGGARTIRTYIEMGAVDHFTIHIAPILLGGGVSLLEGLGPESLRFRPTGVLRGEEAVHIDYEVDSSPE